MEHDCEIFDDSEAALDGLLNSAQWPAPDAAVTARLRAVIEQRAEAVPDSIPIPIRPAAEEITSQFEEAPKFAARSLKIEQAAAPVQEQVEPIADEEPLLTPENLPVVEQSPPILAEIAPVTDQSPGMAVAAPQDDVGSDIALSIPTEPPRQVPGLRVPPVTTAQEHRIPAPRNRRFPVIAIIAIAATFVLALGGAFLLVRSVIRSQHPAGPAVAEARPLPGREPNPYERWVISPEAEKRRLAQKPPPVIDAHRVRIQQLCRTGDARSLASALLHESDEGLKETIFSALVARRDGTDCYLDLLLNPRTRDAALSTLQSQKNPPTRQLLASLDDASVARRLAAAKALGSICHPQMLMVLRQMIEQGDHQREALAVLSECSGSDALRYVQQIKRQPMLASQFTNVRNEMKELF